MLPDGLVSQRSASLHGSRASSASRSSISPEEQQLADDLQTANVILESHGRSTSTSSSTDSEARDSLKDREAKERSMEFIRRHCQVHAHVSPSGSQATSSEKRSSGRGRLTGPQLTSARVLGLASGSEHPISTPATGEQQSTRSKGSSTPTATASASDKASSSSSDLTRLSKGVRSGMMSMGELTDKISKLEQSLTSRDAEAKAMLQSCEDMEEAGNIDLARVKKELAAALKARDIAEGERNRLEVKAAGDKARYDDNMANETLEHEKHAATQKRHEEELFEARKELNQAKVDREKADIDEYHAVASQELSADRIRELEKALALSTARLAAVFEKGGIAASRCDMETDLRAEIKQMEEEQQETGKEMSKIRLELLGLKRDKDRRRVDDQHAHGGSQPLQPPARQGRRGKGRRKGTGQFLEIIDEEDDDLPETASLDNADLASECVSSDHETCSAADLSAQKDLVAKLLNQLNDQKRAMQDLKAEHAGANAEQLMQMELLMQQITESNRENVNMAEEHEVQKRREKSNRMDHIKKLDELHRMMRTMQGQLDDQDVAMKEQHRTAEASELQNVNLEEQLQLQTEALRITSLRLQDALHQHENDTIRHQQEQNSLKLQLAVEKKKTGSYASSAEESASEPNIPQDELLEQRIKDLQEEKCVLLGKLEVKEVQFQLELEEMQREHANKMQEQQRFFNDQLAQLRSNTALQIGAFERSSGGDWVASPPHTLREREGSGGASSQAVASAVSGTAVSGTASPQGTSDCEGTDTSSSNRALGGVKGLIWGILCILPNVAAVICSAEGTVIQNMTQRAAILLGSHLIGKSFYTLVKEENVMSLQRTIMATQPQTEGQGDFPEDLSRTLARHQLEAPSRGPVDLLVSAVHLSANSGGDRHILILLVEQPSERTHHQQSVASSDICPSDSVSVGRRRPQLMRSEVQRTKLRASFFSTRQSAREGSESNSSPRSSLR